ncbi:MAG: PA-phosphatase [Flavobacteriaceae bacterium]|nr:PA-phosphatase [Flavobacteriaceae bacterium]
MSKQLKFNMYQTINKYILVALALLISSTSIGQESTSPYEWKWAREGIWTGVGLAGSTYGLLLIQNKEGITQDDLNKLSAENVNVMDRWAAGYNSEDYSKISDIPFAISFTTPLLLLFDDEVNNHSAQILGLYLQSMATTGAAYAITAGLVNRSRPYVYDEDNSLERRLSNNGQRSFYSGHVAAAATATFFAAKVYSDFNPDARGKGWGRCRQIFYPRQPQRLC